jgi:hypothetical protein
MRFNEIKEASIISRPGAYQYGHKVKLQDPSKKAGGILFDLIKDKVPDFDSDEELTWVEKIDGPVIRVSRSGDASMSFQRPNGTGFTLTGPVNAIESGLNHASGQKGSTAENKGDLAEPLLSAAVVAKLIKRGNDNVEDITIDDLKSTLNKAISSGEQTYKVSDLNSKVSDTIQFKVAIRGPAMQFLKSENFWPKMANIAQAAVHYANSGQIDRYADYFYKNGKADLIKVDSDGLSDQKGRKTDIDAYVRGSDGEMRPLKNLAISLKAGSDTIGQVGGGGLRKDGVFAAAQKLFSPLGINIEKPTEEITSKTKFWIDAYKQAHEQLKEILAGQDAKTEAGVVVKIGEFIAQQGSAGNPNVRLVSLKKTGKSSVHTFKDLAKKLRDMDIDLDSKLLMGKGTGGARPTLLIYDKNSGEWALKIRYSVANSGTSKEKIWNPIEMGPLIQKLTSVQYKSDTQLSKDYIINLKNQFKDLQKTTPKLDQTIKNILDTLRPNDLKIIANADIKFMSDAAKQELQKRRIS